MNCQYNNYNWIPKLSQINTINHEGVINYKLELEIEIPMTTLQLQQLARQCRTHQDQAKRLAKQINMLENQCQAYREMAKKHAAEKQYLGQQVRELQRREEAFKYEKQQTEDRYLSVLSKLEDELQEQKQKYAKLQNKISPLLNHDSVRLQILNEVEGVHFLEIQEHKRIGGNLKDEILKLKRQNQLYKHQIENLKIEHQQELRRIKSYIERKTQDDHLSQTSYELCMDIQNRLRINYQQAKKESDYYKDKYFNCEKRYQQRIACIEKQLLQTKHKLVNV